MRYTSIGLDMGKANVGDYMRKRVVTCDPSCRIARQFLAIFSWLA
jgi:hypothetical protein